MQASFRHAATAALLGVVLAGATLVASPASAVDATKAPPPGPVVVSDGHTPKVVTGDFNGDGKTDLAATGVAGWDSVAVAFSTGGGQFNTTALSTPTFPALAATPGAEIVTGDFNGDGKTDLALTGVAGWDSIPVAFSTGGGQFNTTALSTPTFPALAAAPGMKVVAGDYNGDGKTDLALIGGKDLDSIPVAFSTGGGQFTFTGIPVNPSADPNKMWPQWSGAPGVEAVAGDFNHDSRTDLALTGVPGWTTVPVALSTGSGGFTITDPSVPLFAGSAATAGAQLTTGDFNKDGRTDLALTGGKGWDSVPVAFATGDGGFTTTALTTPSFPQFAATPGARVTAGDFNGDGMTDLALTGGDGWDSVPVAFSTGGGQFNSTALSTPLFPGLVPTLGAYLTSGDFNNDGKTDLAMTGGKGWDSIPVAFSTGGGQFNSTALTTPTFPALTAATAPAGGGVYTWDCLPHPARLPLAPPATPCPTGARAVAGLSSNIRQLVVGKAKIDLTRLTLNTTQIGTHPGDPTSTNEDADIVGKNSTFSLALLNDGTVKSWGDSNEEGQLGDGTTAAHTAPKAVPGLHDVVQISAGHNFTLALTSSGEVWAWGKNDFAELGLGTSGAPVTTPTRIHAMNDVVQVAASDYGGYALHRDGTVSQWGVPSFFRFDFLPLTLPIPAAEVITEPVLVTTDDTGDVLTAVTQISAGYWHALAAKADGSIWSWGENAFGQTGANDASDNGFAHKTQTLPTPVTKLSAGDTQSLAIAGPDHSVYAWGDALVSEGFDPLDEGGHHTLGNVGFYLYSEATRPFDIGSGFQRVALPHPAVDISADFASWGAVLSDGSMWTWHPDLNVPLGGGDENLDLAPVAVPAGGLTQLAMAPMSSSTLGVNGTVIRPLGLGRATG